MTGQLRQIARYALGFLALTTSYPRAEVALYLEPDSSGTVYFKEELDVLEKRSPRPYPPDSSNPVWMVVDYPGNYVGYVLPSQVNKDLSVRQGTPIHVRPSQASAILTTVDDSISPRVLEVGPTWVSVFYEGNAATYYQVPLSETLLEAEVITVSSGPENVTQGGAIIATAEPAPLAEAQPAPLPEVQPAPQPPVTATAASSIPVLDEVIIAENKIPAPASPSLPPISREVARTWEGKLIRNQGLRSLFNKDYPYLLEDASGKTIAYVEVKDVLLFQPIENYWDRQVIIEGTAQSLVDTIPILINARNLRTR